MDIMDPVWGFRRRLAVRVCVSSFVALELAKAKHGCLMAALAQGGQAPMDSEEYGQTM